MVISLRTLDDYILKLTNALMRPQKVTHFIPELSGTRDSSQIGVILKH